VTIKLWQAYCNQEIMTRARAQLGEGLVKPIDGDELLRAARSFDQGQSGSHHTIPQSASEDQAQNTSASKL